MWVLSEPLKSVCETIQSGEWDVYDERVALVLSHPEEELAITFHKDLKGSIIAPYNCDWMTQQEKIHLTSFVRGWLPTYHRNRFMKLAKPT